MRLLRSITYTKPAGTAFPSTIPAFSRDFALELSTPVTFFVGENGTGKSTFLESIADACGFSLLGGNRNHRVGGDAYTTPLKLTLSWGQKTTSGFFMRAESFFDFASYLEELNRENPGSQVFAPYGGRSLHEQSHGESFLALFANRFTEGLFILDEPEAALSPQRQLSFMSILDKLTKRGAAQFLIATHSPILLTYPGATIYSFDDDLRTVPYDETEHFTLTRDFLNAPERFHRHLFD